MRHDGSGGPREDLRQRRTKKFLMTALMELMEERPLSEISVVDICERAMVHRTTFYAHFEDKYALLRYAVSEIYRAFQPAGGASLGGDPRTYFMTIFQNALSFMREHRGLYRSAAFAGGADLQALENSVAEELTQNFAAGGFSPPGSPDLRADIVARFYAGACLALIRWWLDNDMPVSDDVLLSHAERLIFHV